MPGLIAFNRRWDIGSDDLMFPALFEIIVRLFWLIGIAIVFNTHRLSFDCSHGTLVHAYYIGIMVILVCHIIANIAIVTISTRGTIMDPAPRRHMAKLLYLKVSLYLPELLWTIVGTYWAFDKSSNCKSYVAITVKVAACVGWAVFLTLILAIVVVFDPMGSLRHAAEHKRSAAVKLWETRFKVICCCAMCDDKHTDAFTDISKLLAQFFQDVDLVPTDIGAGLLLVHQQQKDDPIRYKLESMCVNSQRSPQIVASVDQNVPDNVPDLIELNDDGDENHHVSSRHGDVVIDRQPLGSSPREYEGFLPSNHHQHSAHKSKHKPRRASPDKGVAHHYNGDMRREPHGSNYEARDYNQVNVTIDQDDVWTNQPSARSPPHLHRRAKPLAVKDWMSLEHAAHYMQFCMGTYTWPLYMYTNLCCGPCKLCPNLTCCHRASRHYTGTIIDDNCCECHLAALVKVTQGRRQDIIYANFNNQIYQLPFYVALDHKMSAVVIAIRGTMSLKDCLTDMTAECSHCQIEGLGEQYVHKGILHAAKYIQTTLDQMDLLSQAFQRAPGYNLVVTGHSLGAGAAALLAILLRPKYRFIQCYAFSPPGWLLSLPLSRYTEDFVVSVVIGEDVVPRLGIRTMESLKINILNKIRSQNQPKYHIIAGGCWSVLCHSPEPTEQRLVSPTGRRSYTQDTENPERTVQDDVDEAIHESDRVYCETDNLYMPGVILYLEEETPVNPIKSLCWETPAYRAAWASQHQFQEILVTPKMLTNHMPDVVLKALKHSAEKGVQAKCVMTEFLTERSSVS